RLAFRQHHATVPGFAPGTLFLEVTSRGMFPLLLNVLTPSSFFAKTSTHVLDYSVAAARRQAGLRPEASTLIRRFRRLALFKKEGYTWTPTTST
ncbi:MAG TPA: hypothetical protein VGW38_16945, partial [Chloroflexota bacterium]|nr:hypothetical protein [Chloroflexota bacterium]